MRHRSKRIDDLLASGHESHFKHTQLGYDPSTDDGEPAHIDVTAGLDDVWADATTVEEFERDIRLLAGYGESGSAG